MKILRKAMFLTLSALCLMSGSVNALAAAADNAAIDITQTGSMDIYKYDLTSAEKDGVWDSSYVSTGVRDEAAVESVLGSNSRITNHSNGEISYGYSLKGVEFSYLRIADIRTYTETENGMSHVEVLYGIPANAATDKLLSAIGVTHANRYAPADQTVDGVLTYYYRSDTLIKGLETSLANNSTTVKNALENYVRDNGGTAMPETDSYGHTSAAGLPLGLYLVVETSVPEMVTSTTAPFFVSLPMTSVDGSNADDGGERWLYDVVLYPKNCTGVPTLEKTLREAQKDTGHNTGSASDITDGYAHTATASGGDVVEYQIISTLPAITSESTYLTEYTFTDTLSPGIAYKKDGVTIAFYRDKSCTDLISTWTQSDGVKKFSVSYGVRDAGTVMTVSMTAAGLEEINSSRLVYTAAGMVNSGYSDCTMRIVYNAVLNSDSSAVCGDGGNPNAVNLTWRRSSTSYYDTLDDDCHLYTYGIDLTKQFSDGAGDLKNVEMLLHNDMDDYYVTAMLHEDDVYYVTGRSKDESNATRFIPNDGGRIIVKGLEDDEYTITETKTDSGYTLLRNSIKAVITTGEGESCGWYNSDTLGVVQNDPRYTEAQKHMEHKLLTASATVDGSAVEMAEDNGSVNAIVPLTVINTKGFDLPRTGSRGTWIYPAVGICVAGFAGGAVYLLRKKRKK